MILGEFFCGCDINALLISWAKTSLPGDITWHHTALAPPLPYESKRIDLIVVISVFTHLSLTRQKLWVEEFKRILSPGGYILITLHGEAYVQLVRPQKINEIWRTGYLENASTDEGSNDYSTFHAYEFVEKLFDGFEIVGYFPLGNTDGAATLVRVAAFQDVYVLKYRRQVARRRGAEKAS
jgi:SAM-dependent methyltransferase